DKCERKEWLGIPWRVAFAMREVGWKIRSEVIWHKPTHVRNAAKDRLTPAHEMLFYFVKSKDAYYELDAIRRPSSPTICVSNCVEFTKKRILEVRGQPATPRQAPLNHAVKVSHGRMR